MVLCRLCRLYHYVYSLYMKSTEKTGYWEKGSNLIIISAWGPLKAKREQALWMCTLLSVYCSFTYMIKARTCSSQYVAQKGNCSVEDHEHFISSVHCVWDICCILSYTVWWDINPSFPSVCLDLHQIYECNVSVFVLTLRGSPSSG